jgi:hypothetical protein
MAVPPWLLGALPPRGAPPLDSIDGGDCSRGEDDVQLFRATAEEHSFTVCGLRFHRQRTRGVAGCSDRCWHSAEFPSWRMFAYGVPDRGSLGDKPLLCP